MNDAVSDRAELQPALMRAEPVDEVDQRLLVPNRFGPRRLVEDGPLRARAAQARRAAQPS